MTDNEIIKALEVHSNEKFDNCEGCPYLEGDFCEGFAKHSKPFRDVLDLINRQKAEKENLEIELKAMRGTANSYKAECDRYKGVIKILEKDVEDAKIRGAKDFGKYLIDKCVRGFLCAGDIVEYCYDFTHEITKIEQVEAGDA